MRTPWWPHRCRLPAVSGPSGGAAGPAPGQLPRRTRRTPAGQPPGPGRTLPGRRGTLVLHPLRPRFALGGAAAAAARRPLGRRNPACPWPPTRGTKADPAAAEEPGKILHERTAGPRNWSWKARRCGCRRCTSAPWTPPRSGCACWASWAVPAPTTARSVPCCPAPPAPLMAAGCGPRPAAEPRGLPLPALPPTPGSSATRTLPGTA